MIALVANQFPFGQGERAFRSPFPANLVLLGIKLNEDGSIS